MNFLRMLTERIEVREMSRDAGNLIPEDIDSAVILTNHVDGALLKRAIKKATERDIPITGGSISDFALAAEGASRLAFRRRESWKLLQIQKEYEKDYRSYDDDYEHNEL